MFLTEYIPQSLRDAWHAEFEQLRQVSMTVLEYAVHFSDLARHAPALVATVRERVHRFIEGLHPSIRINMARELEMDISYQEVVSISRRLEGMLARDREEREAKRSRETSFYSRARAPAARHGRGYMSRPVHSALPAASGVPAPSRPQEPYYAPLVCSVPPAWGAISGHSSRPGPIESVPVVRDFPDVFSADLPGMPPDRDIDFGIDLFTGTQSISIPLYRMAPPELKEQL
ncbi:uncharacterized protein [Nicotiana tomentosiformis]|uniref:uncharacterized protein n=1 Tax=Nicotiana tomentosiformis TaxID=4098 RepID=UPI00388C73EA